MILNDWQSRLGDAPPPPPPPPPPGPGTYLCYSVITSGSSIITGVSVLWCIGAHCCKKIPKWVDAMVLRSLRCFALNRRATAAGRYATAGFGRSSCNRQWDAATDIHDAQTYMTHRHTLRSFRFFLTSQVHHHHRRACYHHHHHQVGRSYTYILFPYRCMVYIRYNWRKYTEVAAILVLKHTCVCRDLSSGPPPPPPWKEVRKLFWWKQLSRVGAWQFVLILPWT